MLEECPIVCECRYRGQKLAFPMDTVYFGEVCQVYADSELYKKGKAFDILKIDPLLSGLDRQYRQLGPALARSFHVGWEYSPKTKAAAEKALSARPDGRLNNPIRAPKSQTDEEAVSRCQITDGPERHSLFIQACISGANGQALIGQAIAEIIHYAAFFSARPALGPFIARDDGAELQAPARIGFIFDIPLPGKGIIEAENLAACRRVEKLYIGPYEMMDDAKLQLRAFIIMEKLVPLGTIYEFYRNDPTVTAPEKLETLTFSALIVNGAILLDARRRGG